MTVEKSGSSVRWTSNPHRRWYDYSRARDEMLAATDTKVAPWYIVMGDDKRRAQLNCIAHLLSLIPYKSLPRRRVRLPKRQKPNGYKEPARRHNSVPFALLRPLCVAKRTPTPDQLGQTVQAYVANECARRVANARF
jgi:hypothetical protein